MDWVHLRIENFNPLLWSLCSLPFSLLIKSAASTEMWKWALRHEYLLIFHMASIWINHFSLYQKKKNWTKWVFNSVEKYWPYIQRAIHWLQRKMWCSREINIAKHLPFSLSSPSLGSLFLVMVAFPVWVHTSEILVIVHRTSLVKFKIHWDKQSYANYL